MIAGKYAEFSEFVKKAVVRCHFKRANSPPRITARRGIRPKVFQVDIPPALVERR